MTAPTGPRYVANESMFLGKFVGDWDSNVSYAVYGPYDDSTDRFEHATRLLVDRDATSSLPTRVLVTNMVDWLEAPGPVAPDALAIPRADILRTLWDALYAHAHESRYVDDAAVAGLLSVLDSMIASWEVVMKRRVDLLFSARH